MLSTSSKELGTRHQTPTLIGCIFLKTPQNKSDLNLLHFANFAAISEALNSSTVFEELLKIKFPIKKISLIDNYNGDDQLSMSDNNSSCFNYRKITNSKIISMHSYGLAIDINPVQNPYIFDSKVENMLEIWPDEGKLYLNRTNRRAGMVEPIVTLFAYYGFTVWGGSWNEPLDYHHFQIDRLHLSDFL